jgi:uncharacterized membrane protein
MNKAEFLQRLESELSGIPEKERLEHINFYSEMIDDRVEEGFSEEDSVAQIGTVEHIVSQIVTDKYYVKQSNSSKRCGSMPTWAIVLLIVGSPLWISIAAAVFAIIIALYAVIWSVVIALWAVFGSFALCGPVCVIGGTLYAVFFNVMAGLSLVSAGLVLSGLAILMYFGSFYTTKGCAVLTALIFKGIINCFRRKEKGNA